MIDELITNINSPRHNIIFNKPKVYAISYYTIDIYNADINHPLHKFWFYIPKAKIIDKTKNYIILALSQNENDKNLIKYVDELENKILRMTKEHLFGSIKKIKKSFTLEDNFPPTIKLDIRGDISVFDINDEEIGINDLEINSLISIYLELDNVMASADEIWSFWKILQVKKLDTIDFKKSFFKIASCIPYHIPEKNISTVTTSSIPIPPLIPPIIIRNDTKPINITPRVVPLENTARNTSGRFEISATDIMDQIHKLKKVNIEKESTEPVETNNNLSFIKISNLKKVETKEPLETSEWYINSMEMEIFENIINSEPNENVFLNILRLKKILFNKINKINKDFKKIIELYQ